MEFFKSQFAIFLLVSAFVTAIKGRSLDKNSTLTNEEIFKLNKFKEKVTPILSHEYMKNDLYLLRWLTARNFNIDEAENMLRSNLEWRSRQKMDTILSENWDAFEKRYKYWHHGLDKQGRPVAYLPFTLWNIRRATLAGERSKLSRYLAGGLERVCSKVWKLQAEGNNVTQVDLIVDLANFNIAIHACLGGCIQVYTRFVSDYENHYPECAHRIILINSPVAFDGILTAIRPILSKQTRDSLEVYGTNKNIWGPILYSYVDKDQLPSEIEGSDLTTYEEQ